MDSQPQHLTRRKFMIVSSAAIASPLILNAAGSMAAAKPAENKTAGTSEAKTTAANIAKGAKVYFIGRGCIGCQTCRTLCPVKAIHLGDGANEIDQNACIHCGTCYEECPTCVITETIV